ncbi:MAG: hypothetical protein QW750_06205 [Zestosphaera sp.]
MKLTNIQDAKLDKTVTSGLYTLVKERIAPIVDEKCKAWAKSDEEYKACKKEVSKMLYGKISHPFSDKAYRPSRLRSLYSVLSKNVGGKPSQIGADANVLVKQMRNVMTNELVGKSLAEQINYQEDLARLALLNMFYGSKGPPEVETPPVRKATAKNLPDVPELTTLSRALGNLIERKCLWFVNLKNKKGVPVSGKDEKKNLYYACRFLNVFNALGASLPHKTPDLSEDKVVVRRDVVTRNERYNELVNIAKSIDVPTDVVNVMLDQQRMIYKEIRPTSVPGRVLAWDYSVQKVRRTLGTVWGTSIGKN